MPRRAVSALGLAWPHPDASRQAITPIRRHAVVNARTTVARTRPGYHGYNRAMRAVLACMLVAACGRVGFDGTFKPGVL
jgi:hypothetical protein